MPNKKLLYMVNDVGFFISHRLVIAKEAVKNGFIVYLSSGDINPIQRKTLSDNNIIYKYIPISRSSKNIFLELTLIFRILFIFIKINPQLTHLITIKPIFYCGFFCRIFKKKTIIAITGLNFFDYIFNNKIKKKSYSLFQYIFLIIYKFILNNKKCNIIVQNKDDFEFIKNKFKVKLTSLCLIKGSGANVDKFCYTKIPKGIPKVILPARMLWDKGIYEFIEAAKIINKDKIIAEFILSGPYDPENINSVPLKYLHDISNNKGISWIGNSNEIDKILSSASLIVLPSYREGLPKSLQEAASSGRAIITTDTNGCREVIENNVTGLLVPLYNINELAEKIFFLLNNKITLINMGLKGRKKALLEFDEKIIIKQHMTLYEDRLTK